MRTFEEAGLNSYCENCGARNGAHRSSDGRCPPRGVKEPKWPKTIKDEKRAGEVYDKRLASFWNKSKTYWR